MHPLPPPSAHISRTELAELHKILRAPVRLYVDKRLIDDTAEIPEETVEAFAAFVSAYPHLTHQTLADVLYRLTLGAVYNCFQIIRKSIKDPSNVTLAVQYSIEISLALSGLPIGTQKQAEDIHNDISLSLYHND